MLLFQDSFSLMLSEISFSPMYIVSDYVENSPVKLKSYGSHKKFIGRCNHNQGHAISFNRTLSAPSIGQLDLNILLHVRTRVLHLKLITFL